MTPDCASAFSCRPARRAALFLFPLLLAGCLGGGSGADVTTLTAINSGIIEISVNHPVSGNLQARIPPGVTPRFTIVQNGSRGTAAIDDPVTGRFTYTPHTAGGDAFTFRVNDSNTAKVQMLVKANQGPVFGDNPGPQTVIVDNLLEFTVVASDNDGPSLTIGASELPEGAELADCVYETAGIAVTGSCQFRWTPAETDLEASPYEASFIVSDGAGETTEKVVTIAVIANVPPVLQTIGDRTVQAEKPLGFTVSASDPDGPAPLTLDIISGKPEEASFEPASIEDGDTVVYSFSWTPSGPDVGVHELTFSAADVSGRTSSETIKVTVTPPNQPPTLAPIGPHTVATESPLTIMVSANDPDGPAPLILGASPLPVGASFSDHGGGAGEFSWTPSGPGAVGAYQVTFTAADGEDLAASETVTITVEPNQPPTLAPIGDQTVVAENPLSFSVSATDNDGPAPLTLDISGAPEGASFEATSTEDDDTLVYGFSWTPTGAEVAGIYQITFTATDGAGNSASEEISIEVEPNQPPVLAPIGGRSANVDSLLSFAVSASDPDGPAPLVLMPAVCPRARHSPKVRTTVPAPSSGRRAPPPLPAVPMRSPLPPRTATSRG